MKVKLSSVNEENIKFILVRCFSDESDLGEKEANFYSSDWWEAMST